MNYEWIDAYCLLKKGVERDFKVEWDATRYMIRGKMFAMQGGDKENRPIFTIKLEPSYGELLRLQFKDIIPGYYMNKEHWNSLYLSGNVPKEVVMDMIDKGYEAVLNSFSKKDRAMILGV
ncbi:MAG: MmcQ/YjbR family DNA-binding protein [Christensenellales bacterium]